MKHTVLLGGDVRQDLLGNILAEKGWRVSRGWTPSALHVSVMETAALLQKADLVLLPLPVTKDGVNLNSAFQISLTEVLSYIPQKTPVLGGLVPQHLQDRYGVREYYHGEQLLCDNAATTAECALGLGILTVPFVLQGSDCAVAGCGRIGSRLSLLLQSVGANVTVFARSARQRKWAKDKGLLAEDLSCLKDAKTDLICNTVPYPYLQWDDPVFQNGAWYMELASAPGGCPIPQDRSKYIAAGSLPGRYAPLTAAKHLAAALERITGEEQS